MTRVTDHDATTDRFTQNGSRTLGHVEAWPYQIGQPDAAMSEKGDGVRVLIVADHASLRFGGEAALPYHYFRVLRARGVEAWLVAHERCREELEAAFPQDRDRLCFVRNTLLHRALWSGARMLPMHLGYITFGMITRMLTQLQQRRVVRDLVREQRVDVVHQPMPVSPREPSLFHRLGAPLIIGPMNGGMDYPSPFVREFQGRGTSLMLWLGRFLAAPVHWLLPGKRRAAMLLVANTRTARSLPSGVQGRVVELVENGVDLTQWCDPAGASTEVETTEGSVDRPIRFIFIGRLIPLKGVELLLQAFARVVTEVPCELELVGDGPERESLTTQARALGFDEQGPVHFAGWQSQAVCAKCLARSDVLVLPSLRECGGAVVLEAMAMRKPVIATAWGGPGDYVDDTCGILVEPTSRQDMIDGLVEAMLALARSREKRTAMGEAGHRRVIEHFDWERKVDRILDLYRQVASPSAAASHSQSELRR